jgi:hypothetical protein
MTDMGLTTSQIGGIENNTWRPVPPALPPVLTKALRCLGF